MALAVAEKEDVRNPKLIPGAYVRRGTRLYRIVGPQRNAEGRVTGNVEIENVLTLHLSTDTPQMITQWYDLVKPAPAIGNVPLHLQAEMAEHCKAVGL